MRYVVTLLCVAAALFFAGSAAQFDTVSKDGTRIYTAARKLQLRKHVTEMFHHGYSSYMKYAFPQDELKPLSCSGSNVFGGYSLTLIDSLDMLALVGDYEEFFKQVRYIGANVKFESNLKVSVFETTIRVLGGLLSAHLIALDKGPTLRARTDVADAESKFQYDGELLNLAVVVADKLMPAFNTPTGIPFNEIHLQMGVNKADGHASCPAAAGSLLLEFGLLTQLTGDCKYLTVARRAILGVWKWRAPHQIVGTMIDIFSGVWLNPQTNIGASVDSFFEYMFKAYVLFDDDTYYDMWLDAYKSIQKYTYFGGWYLTGTMEHTNGPLDNFDHQINALQAFWPGLQAIAGETHQAVDAYEKMLCVVRSVTFMPEYLGLRSFLDRTPDRRIGPGYPLRPEFIESTYFLYKSTGDDTFIAIAHRFLEQLSRAKVPCGFAAIVDIYTMAHEDKMDSFMLAETLKYLYFIFTPTDAEVRAENLDRSRRAGHLPKLVHPLPYDLELHYIVNTEAHPIPVSRDLRMAYRDCMSRPEELMPLNNQQFVDFETSTRRRESFGRTAFEDAKQCPVVDYMRDVAPFIQRLHAPDLHCYEKQFSILPLRSSNRHNSQTPQAVPNIPNKQPEETQYRIVYIGVPADPHRAVLSSLMSLVLHQPLAAHPWIASRSEHSVTVITPEISASSLFMAMCKTVLRVIIPGTNISGGIATWPATFGSTPCGTADTAGHLPSGSKFARAPLYVASSLLCPRPDGTFGSEDDDLRSYIEGGIPDIVWHANFSNAPRRPDFGLLASRGGCTFTEKAHVAQQLGASFLIVANTEDTGLSMAPTTDLRFSTEITIPVFMVKSSDGDRLRQIFTLTQPIAPANLMLASAGFVELICVSNAMDQFGALDISIAFADDQALLMLRSSLVQPTPFRSLSISRVAYESFVRHKPLSYAEQLIHLNGAAPVVPLQKLAPPGKVVAREHCHLEVGVDAINAERGVRGSTSDYRGATIGIQSLFNFLGEHGRLSVRVLVDYAGDAPASLESTSSFAAALYRNVWIYQQQPSDEVRWSVATVTVASLIDDADLERHEHRMSLFQSWVTEHGLSHGIVGRFVGYNVGNERKLIEVLVYSSVEAKDAFSNAAWSESPAAHDGHVLQAILQAYRSTQPGKTSTVAAVFDRNDGVFIQPWDD